MASYDFNSYLLSYLYQKDPEDFLRKKKKKS